MADECGACGAVLAGDEKFCGTCGVALAATAPLSATPPAREQSDPAQLHAPASRAKPQGSGGKVSAWIVTGLVLSATSFIGNLVAAATNSAASAMLVDAISALRIFDFGTIFGFVRALPWLTSSLLAALLASAVATMFPQTRTNLFPRPLPAALCGLIAGLVSVALVMVLMTGFHAVVPRLDRDALPLGIISMVTGLGVSAVVLKWFHPVRVL